MTSNYLNPGPGKDETEALKGAVLLEFGTNWCGHCKAATPLAEEALKEFPGVPHIQVEDGQGRKLGRIFKVKLWPTFIVLKDGVEVSRSVRPLTSQQISEGIKLAL